ncbi:MAG: hypothetical protein ACXVFU_11725 [Nocardioidaceae bacterium]
MALVQNTESILETDFNLLFAAQRVEWDPPDATFAASAPGFIAMKAGARFARLRVRLERWDERPPPPGDEWEDIDELPWASIPGGGPVVVNGFDPPEDGDGLVVEDLARARVEVLATGRHRYDDDEAPDHLPREEWLLRW